MSEYLQPKTYLIGSTQLEHEGFEQYLKDTGQEDFLGSVAAARSIGISEGECLISFGAKLCYKSLVLGKNSNITRVRDIPGNVAGCIGMGHSSVFGHLCLNFVTTNCSRLFTHELIRHEVGTEISIPPLDGLHEWSQTSGRYVRLESVDIVWDPILEGCEDLGVKLLCSVEDTIYLMECRKGLRVPSPLYPDADAYTWLQARRNLELRADEFKWVPNTKLNDTYKKQLTSAIRRFAVNGQVNEIMWSVNVRALRHMLQMRTSRFAEYEIRLVFNQVFDLVKDRFTACFADAKGEKVGGLVEITGMHTQPYAPKPLSDLPDKDLVNELTRRGWLGLTFQE
jgi:thymidylate synthase (FAD)